MTFLSAKSIVSHSEFVSFSYNKPGKSINIIYGIPFEGKIADHETKIHLELPNQFEKHKLQIELIDNNQNEFYFKDLETGLAYQKTSDGKVRLCEDNEFVNYEKFDYTDAVRNFMLNNSKH